MKIWEIDWNSEKTYIDNRGEIWFIDNHNLINKFSKPIECCYRIFTILNLEFEEHIDWSKVKVDTKVLVKDVIDKNWTERHFAKYESGKVYVFVNGGTSWTTKYTNPYNYTKLAD